MTRWVAWVLLAGLSCRGQGNSTKNPPRRARAGVHVPLPETWQVQVAEGENFRAGPTGHAVLRIDSASSISQVPTAKELEMKLIRDEPGLSVRLVEAIDRPDTVVGIFQLGSEKRPAFYAMLGVRRVQGQVFFCSTVPGASQADVRLAGEACANVSVSEVP